jgi:putative membrane protein
MKKLLLAAVIAVAFFAFQSCGNDNSSGKGNSDTTSSMNDSSKKSGDSSASSTSQETRVEPADKASIDFAGDAASGGMMEVTLGKMAQEKAVSQRVKDFGAMMVADHTRANEDLIARAKTQNITIPETVKDDEQKMMDKLKKKSGRDFDKTYMDMMVEDHNKDVEEFKKAAEKCTNSSIRDFASQTLPVLQKHLDSARAITGKH